MCLGVHEVPNLYYLEKWHGFVIGPGVSWVVIELPSRHRPILAKSFFQDQKANDFPLLIEQCKAADHYEGRQWNL